MKTKLHYRLYAVGIAFLAGFITGSIFYGFLHAHVENGTTLSLCGAGAVLFVLLSNWLKKEDSDRQPERRK